MAMVDGKLWFQARFHLCRSAQAPPAVLLDRMGPGATSGSNQRHLEHWQVCACCAQRHPPHHASFNPKTRFWRSIHHAHDRGLALWGLPVHSSAPLALSVFLRSRAQSVKTSWPCLTRTWSGLSWPTQLFLQLFTVFPFLMIIRSEALVSLDSAPTRAMLVLVLNISLMVVTTACNLVSSCRRGVPIRALEGGSSSCF